MNKNIELTVSNTLKNLGVTPAILGYQYLRYAIMLAIDDPDIVHCVTKRLYPIIAGHFNTTTARVERAIRHAIDSAWAEPNEDIKSTVFGRTVKAHVGRPTNSEFIATVTDWLYITGEVSHAT